MRERTLQETEARLAPVVACALALLWAAVWVLLAHAWAAAGSVGWKVVIACAGLIWFASCSLTIANIVRSGHLSIGSVPPAVLSLVPAAVIAAILTRGPVRVFALACLVLGLATLTFLAWWFRQLWAVCHTDRAVAEDAVIICLGGAVRNGHPLPTLRSRLETCLALARESEGRTIVCTGARVLGEDVSEAEVMRRYLVAHGLDDRRILVEDTARTTRENIERSVELVREAGLSGELCVCSSDYHLLRATDEGRRCNIALVPIAAPTPAPLRLEQWCREALTCAHHGVRPR